MIRCAHCKGKHDTVAQVRLCAKREERDAQAWEEHQAALEAALEAAADQAWELEEDLAGRW